MLMPKTNLHTAICITGAHRSGTSMLAHLLHRCGLYFGAQWEMMPPQADNVEGFWENLAFVSLNEELLAMFNGSWDMPPQIPSIGTCSGEPMRLLQAKAETLLERFQEVPFWGWKDPRNCLTLPFWRYMIPDLRVVLIVRHPVEVAQSLNVRNGVSPAFALNLWRIYHQRVLSYLDPEDLIVARYDSFLIDPLQEMNRIVESLQLPHTEIERAVEIISPGARNHHYLNHAGESFHVPADVLRLYERLNEESARFRNGRSSEFDDGPAEEPTSDMFENWAKQARLC
jgi:hypothetical protein